MAVRFWDSPRAYVELGALVVDSRVDAVEGQRNLSDRNQS